jgi:hypothetical protein
VQPGEDDELVADGDSLERVLEGRLQGDHCVRGALASLEVRGRVRRIVHDGKAYFAGRRA